MKGTWSIKAYLVTLCLFFSISATAQGTQPGIFSPTVPQDTVNEADTIIQKNGFLTLFEGKPGRAALYGLLIPSGGQLYNRKWWKVPLALAIDGGLAYFLVSNTSNYRSAQSEYELILAGTITGDANRTKARRDFYRKWREYSWVYLIAGHLLTVADAYVDRHLMHFDVSPDLSLLQSGMDNGAGMTFGITVAIPFTPKNQQHKIHMTQKSH